MVEPGLKNTAKKVVNYGSINIDHVYRVPHFVQAGETLNAQNLISGLGGKGANQSVALARAGVSVCHVGQLGRADQWALSVLEDAGIDTSAIRLVDSPSGHAIIQVNQEGENSILLHGGANQQCSLEALSAALEDSASIAYLLLQNECNGLADAIDLAHQKRIKVVLNPAPMNEEISALPLDKLAVLIVNQIEAELLWGTREIAQIVERVTTELAQTTVILTLGSEGSVLIAKNEFQKVAAFTVEAIDTTAAGDTFVGYFLAGLVEGQDTTSAMRLASAAAALTATSLGAVEAIPNQVQVMEFLSAQDNY